MATNPRTRFTWIADSKPQGQRQEAGGRAREVVCGPQKLTASVFAEEAPAVGSGICHDAHMWPATRAIIGFLVDAVRFGMLFLRSPSYHKYSLVKAGTYT
jgi:hypothetical protein